MYNEKVLRLALFSLIISSFLPIFLFKAPFVKSATNHVVISEIQTTGGTGKTLEEFIELYNPTDSDVDVTNWKLAKRTEAGSSDIVLIEDFPSSTIKAYGFILISHESYGGVIGSDFTYNSSSIVDDNTFYLYDDTDSLVDKVGIGSAGDSETTTFLNPLPANSIERKYDENSDRDAMETGGSNEFLGNGYDTDNNSNDFIRRSFSQPQNSNSDTEFLEPSPTPEMSSTPSVIPTSTPDSTSTPSPEPSLSPTPEPTQSPTPEPAVSPTPEPTETPTPTPSESPSPTPTETPEPTETPTPEPTQSPTPEPTVSPTPEPTIEPTPVPTETPTPTPPSKSMIIGMFLFPGRTSICKITYNYHQVHFLRFVFPSIFCTKTR